MSRARKKTTAKRKSSTMKKPRKTVATRASERVRATVGSGALSAEAQLLFVPLMILSLVLWVLYRRLFVFPPWFDESIGKALFFGLPVWVFVTATQSKKIIETFSISKLKTGVLLGIAVGGVFGFTTSILSLLRSGGVVEAVPLFSSNQFWNEFILAMMTAFWETLLFYSFIMTVIMDRYPNWSLHKRVILTALIFLLFHIPNTYLRFSLDAVAGQLFLLFLFGMGQAYLFAARRNGYALVLSHAIWGMVLLLHVR